MSEVEGVEVNERGEKTPVSIEGPIAEQLAAGPEPLFRLVEHREDGDRRLLIRLLSRRKARLVYGVVERIDRDSQRTNRLPVLFVSYHSSFQTPSTSIPIAVTRP
jgi:hypothetical protein